MKIGLFSDSISVPPKEGISVHVHEFLHYIASQTAHEVVLFMCDRGMVDTELLKSEPFTTVLVPEKDFFSIDSTCRMLEQFGIDIAQSHKTYIAATVLGEACRQAKIPMISEFHDLEKNVVPLYFKGADAAGAIKKHVMFQQKAATYASLVRVMSRFDYDDIIRKWGMPLATTFRWFPVAAAPAAKSFRLHPDRAYLSYVGNMSYAPNAEGAEAIVSTLVPAMPTHHFCFVGRESEQYSSDSVDARGMVDDLTSVLEQTAIGLAPIFSGSGMKIKNLTYLKHGIPVITTSVGAQGYPPSEAIIVEDDLSKWPNIIRYLISDRKQLERLSREARRVFTVNFSETVVNHKVLDAYQRCIDHYQAATDKRPITRQEEIDPLEMYWLREFREHCTQSVKTPTIIRSAHSRLVVIEGLPGSGKSTLMQSIRGEPSISLITELVAPINVHMASPYIDHDRKKYSRVSGSGVTLMDRGHYSTLAVEEALGDPPAIEATMRAIDESISCGMLYEPELIIYLDIDEKTSLTRQDKTNAPLWRDRATLTKVRQYYQSKLCARTNVIVIDGRLSREQIAKTCRNLLREKFGDHYDA